MLCDRKRPGAAIDDEDEEDDTKVKKSSGPQFVREFVGNLEGLDIWQTDVREILIEKIERRAQEFDQLNIFGLSEPKLLVWVRWYESLEGEFSAAKALIDSAQRFFAKDNIKLAMQMQLSEITSRKVRQLTWDTTKYRWK